MLRNSEFFSIGRIFLGSISFRERRRLIILVSIQVLVNLIDLVGVGFLGIVGAITISGIQSQKPSSNVLRLLQPLGIDQQPFQIQVSVLAVSATVLLVARTVISLWLARKTFSYFASKSIEFSEAILGNVFRNQVEKIRLSTSQELIYSTTTGCDILMIGVFAQGTVLISDIALLLLMGGGVAILQPTTAAISFLLFGSAAAYMHLVLNKKSKELGRLGANQAIINGNKIQELFSSYREIYIANKSDYFISDISKSRRISTTNQAEINYLPILNKYFLETTLLVGALLVAAVEFALHDARSAVSVLAIFLAAGSRLAPALLRVQQNMLNIRNSMGGARSTVSKIEEIGKMGLNHTETIIRPEKTEIIPSVFFRNVTFSYQNSPEEVLKDLNLEIKPGTTLAITGPSGSGKTTFVDLMLGILKPTHGEILISGVDPRTVVSETIYKAAYVPQEVQLLSATLLENIALGVPKNEINLERVEHILDKSLLREVAESLVDGLNTRIGEEGVLLSGGQKQRIGIARALYDNPKLIAFDEPTSALDGEAEGFIAATIEALHGTATIVVIAHRLNTLKNVDKVIYLENGKLMAEGKFEEVRNQVVNFDQNATSAGM